MRLSLAVGHRRLTAAVCAAAGAALMLSPIAATAASAVGTVFGGATTQQFPVVIETNKSGQKVVHAMIAIRLTCTSGAIATVPDHYGSLPVKHGKFTRSFGPDTIRNDDGTTTDFEGAISGTFNKARTKASGKWSLKATDHDSAGAITDTCDSGSVSWTAKP